MTKYKILTHRNQINPRAYTTTPNHHESLEIVSAGIVAANYYQVDTKVGGVEDLFYCAGL